MTRIALITGANRGLGFETARQLGELGMTTLIGSRDAAKGERAAAKLRSQGLDATTLQLDVDSDSSTMDAAAHVARQYGRLDVLVNNAGILPEATARDIARPVDVRMFTQTFETNVFGAVRVIQSFLPLLRLSSSGRIVNVSSTMGSLSDQIDPSSPYYEVVVPAYQASKVALNALTIALAKTLDDTPIKTNSTCPGWVQTDLGGPDSRAAAPLSADKAARIIVEMASIPDDGPSGQFVDSTGTVPW